ncbi:MAG: bifunctional hydroxymethylpyrimidine kinase/phosphomethylpyrimidine kinase [Gemmatimonadetes bacterium]|nr:bifunctional hydroxymethylpyrimidine kinase/phosphomethylpyrimidine kinase [Gemmatimonadota bacterium]
MSSNHLSTARLRTLLAAMRGRRIAVIGDAMLDVYLRGDVERISPEAPVPVVRVRERKYALGGAANVGQNVVASGAIGALVAVVGDDPSGARFAEMWAAHGGDGRGVLRVERPTTTKTRLVARSQQVVRFDEEDDADLGPADRERICGAIDAAIADCDAVVLEDYNKGVLTAGVITHAMERAQARGVPVVVDPKFRNFFAYRGATIFKPNRRELESALGAAVHLDDAGTLPATLHRLGAGHLLLTLGERGMALVGADGEVHQIQSAAREVYDVVGAGDTVTAYLATSLAAGATALEAAIVANLAAGVEVGKLGAATVSPEEIEAAAHQARVDPRPPG